MIQAKNSLTDHSNPVKLNFSPASSPYPSNDHFKRYVSGGSPSLDKDCESNAQFHKPWDRHQKRVFARAISWMTEAASRGCQLFWICLTTAPDGKAEDLERDFQELRRRVERRFKYYVEYFSVRTSEGNGVLHQVWAIKDDRTVWISQHWLSEEWEKIHGAHRVWIKRISRGDSSHKNIGRYIVTHYLGDQSQLKNMSYSWWRSKFAIGKAWEFYKRHARKFSDLSTYVGFNQNIITVTYREMLKGWHQVLTQGYTILGSAVFFINNRQLDLGLLCRENIVKKTMFQTIAQ